LQQARAENTNDFGKKKINIQQHQLFSIPTALLTFAHHRIERIKNQSSHSQPPKDSTASPCKKQKLLTVAAPCQKKHLQ
jgi:hypothetical protein